MNNDLFHIQVACLKLPTAQKNADDLEDILLDFDDIYGEDKRHTKKLRL